MHHASAIATPTHTPPVSLGSLVLQLPDIAALQARAEEQTQLLAIANAHKASLEGQLHTLRSRASERAHARAEADAGETCVGIFPSLARRLLNNLLLLLFCIRVHRKLRGS